MLGKCQVLICAPGKPRNRQGQACADAAGWVEAVPRPFSSFSAGHPHGHQFCTKGSFPTKPTKPIIRGKKKKTCSSGPIRDWPVSFVVSFPFPFTLDPSTQHIVDAQ